MGKSGISDVLEGKKQRDSLKKSVEALKGVGDRLVCGGAAKTRICKRSKKQLRRKTPKVCYENDIFPPNGLVSRGR